MKVIKLSIFFILILLIVHFAILASIQFIAWPEMLAYPYLLSKGFLLYQDIINPYPPFLSLGLFFLYSQFGFSLPVLQIISFVTIFITDIILIIVIRKIFNLKTVLLTLVIFVLIQPLLEGNGLWFDLLISPLLILIYYLNYQLLVNFQKNKPVIKYVLLSAVILSFAFLIKQTSIFILISIGILYLITFKRFSPKIKVLTLYGLIFLLPVILTSFVFFKQGLFPDYLFWVYQYPFWHLKSPGFLLYPTIKQAIIIMVLLLPAIYALFKYRSDKRIYIISFVFIPALLFSLPRFSYFHLQPALPYICLLTAYLIIKIYRQFRIIVFVYVLILGLFFIYFFAKYVNKQPRFYDAQTINTALYLSGKLKDKGPIFFYNIPSQYFVIGNLLPTKPWVDTFPWYLEVNGFQQRITQSLNNQQVNYTVFKKFANEGNNIPGSYIPKIIDGYIWSNYLDFEGDSNTIRILKRKPD